MTVAQVIGPLLTTLVRMHKAKVLHRDIKPENLFLSASHELIVGDLGLAICAATEIPYARSGTLDYMSPEACSLRHEAKTSLPSSTSTQQPSVNYVRTCGTLQHKMVTALHVHCLSTRLVIYATTAKPTIIASTTMK